MTELDGNVRPKNPFNASQNLLRRLSGNLLLRSLTNFELKKPGMASKKFDILSSSPRSSIVQRKMRTSISDNCSDAVSSAAFSTPPKIQPRERSLKSRKRCQELKTMILSDLIEKRILKKRCNMLAYRNQAGRDRGEKNGLSCRKIGKRVINP